MLLISVPGILLLFRLQGGMTESTAKYPRVSIYKQRVSLSDVSTEIVFRVSEFGHAFQGDLDY